MPHRDYCLRARAPPGAHGILYWSMRPQVKLTAISCEHPSSILGTRPSGEACPCCHIKHASHIGAINLSFHFCMFTNYLGISHHALWPQSLHSPPKSTPTFVASPYPPKQEKKTNYTSQPEVVNCGELYFSIPTTIFKSSLQWFSG